MGTDEAMTEDGVGDFYDKARANIERTGRSCVHVFGDFGKPPFSYTIGNSLQGLPELLVFGLRPQDAQDVLNLWSSKMIERGAGFANGELVDLGGAFPCLALRCGQDAREDYTIQATRFLGSDDYAVTQIVVPDPSGRFPGDEACEAPYRDVPLVGVRH